MKSFLIFISIYLLLSANSGFSQNCFSIGSSMNDVKAVQGTPSSIGGSSPNGYWMYEISSVDFENGRVKGYSNISGNLKICTNTNINSNNLTCFSIGSSMNDVKAVQGTPSSIGGSSPNGYWMYEISSVDFENGRVKGYSNISGNLKICKGETSLHYDKPETTTSYSEQNSEPINSEPTKIIFKPFIGKVTNDVSFWSKPSQSSVRMQSLVVGSQIYVFSKNSIKGYYKVIDITTNKIGWVDSDCVKFIKYAVVNENGGFQSTGSTSNFNSEVKIVNKSSHNIKLIVGEETISLNPNSTKTVYIKPERKYYVASAVNVIPTSGFQLFESYHGYEWEFWVSSKR